MTPEELETIRKNASLSPTEMAKAMGVHYNTYRNFVVGRHNLSKVTAQLATVLDAIYSAKDMEDLLGRLEGIGIVVGSKSGGD